MNVVNWREREREVRLRVRVCLCSSFRTSVSTQQFESKHHREEGKHAALKCENATSAPSARPDTGELKWFYFFVISVKVTGFVTFLKVAGKLTFEVYFED